MVGQERGNVATLCISMGDPAGIGPEVALKALLDDELRASARWVLVGEAWQISELGRELGFQADQIVTSLEDDDGEGSPGVVVLDAGQLEPDELTIGQVSAACGRAGLAYVRLATQLCLAGRAQAIVTAPLNKEAVALNGEPFCGHTEYIAELCDVPESRMLLYNDRLCVVHVSTHCSLAEATRVSVERIQRTIEMGHDALVRLTGESPRIAVCGLNPHAGENGMFGDEEVNFIIPAIEQANANGIQCDGPYPADTLFMQAMRGKCDLVVAMYHDQGHVAMKVMDFEHTVNVTLGLPIVRTSVDHGTAFDIAGKNLATCDDMQTTMRLAIRMVKNRRSESATAQMISNKS